MSRPLGYRIGRLILIGRKRESGRSICVCKCDCGNIKEVLSSNWSAGKTESCGCYGREQASKNMRAVGLASKGKPKPWLHHVNRKKLLKYASVEEVAFFSLYQGYKYSAKRRHLQFTISSDEFRFLTKQPCFYCGAEPAGNWKTKSGGQYVFNGIDRNQNSAGYTLENSVSCCWPCNKMKTDWNSKDFIEHARKIVRRCGEKT